MSLTITVLTLTDYRGVGLQYGITERLKSTLAIVWFYRFMWSWVFSATIVRPLSVISTYL